MTSTEKRLKYKQVIEDAVSQKYKSSNISSPPCFAIPTGGFFRIQTMGGKWNALVIEYAENEREARLNQFEDGDLFYMEDYQDAESMYEAMIAEIEG